MCPFLLPVLLNKRAPGHLLGKKFLDLGDSAKLTGHRCGFTWVLSSDRLACTKIPGAHTTLKASLTQVSSACPLHRRPGPRCARPRKVMWDQQLLWDCGLREYLHICSFPSVATLFPSSYNANDHVHALAGSTLLTTMRGRWLYHPVFHLRKLKG